jgi:hypothetical protein
VPLTELACREVGRDSASGTVRPNSATLQPLSEPSGRACRQLVRLYGVENWCTTRRREGACALGRGHVRVGCVLVGDGNYSCKRVGCWRRGGDSSCGTETPRVRRRLVVRGGASSCGVETCRRSHLPDGDLSGKPPTGRSQGVLPVKFLIGICSPPYAGSWPSHCQWCLMTPSRE